jgi:hypothetical protein
MNEQFMQILEAIGPSAMLIIIQALSQMDEQTLQQLIQTLQQAARQEQGGAQQGQQMQQAPPQEQPSPAQQSNANLYGNY